jgi:hypothetical protein
VREIRAKETGEPPLEGPCQKLRESEGGRWRVRGRESVCVREREGEREGDRERGCVREIVCEREGEKACV